MDLTFYELKRGQDGINFRVFIANYRGQKSESFLDKNRIEHVLS
jgi:hypothetical protein